jgi:hypothetical protein
MWADAGLLGIAADIRRNRTPGRVPLRNLASGVVRRRSYRLRKAATSLRLRRS